MSQTDIGGGWAARGQRGFIALLLGLMTALTFANVALRYGFNTGIIWGLETTSFLFAWMVLLGAAHCTHTGAHLGVDVVVQRLQPAGRRKMGNIAAACCVLYAVFFLKGAWDYWANFANLPATTGRWLPTGLEEMRASSYRGWYEVTDTPLPSALKFLEPLMNEGEPYEKLPRFIPYFALPLGALFLFYAYAQAWRRVAKGEDAALIVMHGGGASNTGVEGGASAGNPNGGGEKPAQN